MRCSYNCSPQNTVDFQLTIIIVFFSVLFSFNVVVLHAARPIHGHNDVLAVVLY